MRLFRFRNEQVNLDLGRHIDGDPRLRALRDDLASRHGQRRAQAMVEDLLVVALRRFGDHYIAVKGELLDRVVHLRDRLETLYQGALHRGPEGQGRGRGDFAAQLQAIEDLYGDLDGALADISAPAEGLSPPPANDTLAQRFREQIAAEPATARRQTDRPVGHDLAPETGSTRSRVQRKGFREQADGAYRYRFRDGATAEFRVRDGMFHVTTRDRDGHITSEFREFDVLHTPYGSKPRVTSIMQAHHGLQSDLMRRTFGRFGYDHYAVPTIWLRDSKSGSPHGSITDMQRVARSQRARGRPTYAQIRSWAIQDFRGIGAPEAAVRAYLTAMDSYMRRAIVPELRRRGRLDLLGDWDPS